MTEDAPRPALAREDELKTRVFAAFEHACRQGELEIADSLLAIINKKWMRPARPARHCVPGPFHLARPRRTYMASR